MEKSPVDADETGAGEKSRSYGSIEGLSSSRSGAVADDNDGFWVGTDDATQHASEETVKLRSREEEDWLDSVDSSAPISPDVEVEWMKALLFVHTMCRSSWGRFAQVFFLSKGIGTFRIGIIQASMVLIESFTQPFWGWFADVTGRKRRVFAFTQGATTMFFLLLSINTLTSSFVGVLCVATMVNAFGNVGITNGHIVTLEQRLQVTGLFGKVRLYGAVAWGLGALLMGIFNSFFGWTGNTIFYTGTSLTAILLSMRVLSVDPPKDRKQVVSKEVLPYLTTWRSISFFSEVLVAGIAQGFVERFLFIYLIDELGASTALCGGTVLLTVLFEIPIFHYYDKIESAIGRGGVLIIAYICYVVRVFGYTLLTTHTVECVFLLETMHGITFALSYSSSVEYSRKLAPHQWVAFMQSLLYVVFFCLGPGVASLVGGFVMQTYGGKPLYLGAAMSMSGVVALRVLKLVWDLRQGTYFDNPDTFVHESPRHVEAATPLTKSALVGQSPMVSGRGAATPHDSAA